MKVYFLYHTLMGAHEKPRYTCSRRYMKRCLSRDPHVVRKDIFCLHVCLRRFSSLYNSLSFIEVHFGFDIGFSFLLSHSALGLRLYLDYILWVCKIRQLIFKEFTLTHASIGRGLNYLLLKTKKNLFPDITYWCWWKTLKLVRNALLTTFGTQNFIDFFNSSITGLVRNEWASLPLFWRDQNNTNAVICSPVNNARRKLGHVKNVHAQ